MELFDIDKLKEHEGLAPLVHHYENTEDKSHNIDHISRVLNEAKTLSAKYPKHVQEGVLYGALLHDIDREKDHKYNTNVHEITGANTAKKYLNDKASHLTYQQKNDIIDAVRNHRSSTASPNMSLTAKLVSDADRLAVSFEDLAIRPYRYRLEKGMSEDEALRDSFWYLRNRKLKTLKTLGKNLHLDESKSLYESKMKEFEKMTKSFKDYQKLLGIKNPIEFKTTTKSEVKPMHTKKAWLETAVEPLANTPATRKLAERLTRGTLRKEYHNVVLGDQDPDNKPPTPIVTSATWLDTTPEKPII